MRFPLTMGMGLRLCIGVLALGAEGCGTDYPPVPEDCGALGWVEHLRFPPPQEIDVIIVVDSSPSMAEEAAVVPARLAALVDLSATLDRDGDGYRDYGAADFAFHIIESDRALIDAAVAKATEPDVLRDGATLSVIVITDADDASVGDPASLATRMGELRAHPELVTLAVVGGVPPDLALSNASVEEMLADPRLGTSPSCRGASATATAPTRLLQLAAAMQTPYTGTSVVSICSDDWRDALTPPLEYSNSLGARCVPTPLTTPDGLAQCVIYEALDPKWGPPRCDDLPGRVATDFSDGDRVTCLIEQLAGPAATSGGSGWYLEARDMLYYCGENPRIVFTPDVQFLPGSLGEMRCALPPPGGVICE